MRRYINGILHPEAYHGTGRRPPFFEGWYYKLVDGARTAAWAIIPGVHYAVDSARSEAFIMVVDGRTHQAQYHAFPPTAFSGATDMLDVRIGDNRFAADGLTLALPAIKGTLSFVDIDPWPVTLAAPGIMGWYAWFPMECYHGVVSLDHAIEGQLTFGRDAIDFSGGRGYTEKDWGQAFPQTWIWLQANHFAAAGTSLTASVARIPFRGRVFPGFIIGLRHAGELHRFTTYARAHLDEVALTENGVRIVTRNRTHRLVIEAERGPTALLHAPTRDRGMVPKVAESVGARVHLTLSDSAGRVLLADESGFAGLEIEGDTRILLTDG